MTPDLLFDYGIVIICLIVIGIYVYNFFFQGPEE